MSNLGNKINTNGFKQNPQNINRSGANRKSFSTINKSLKEQGIKELSKKELLESYSLIFNATEQELIKISTDASVPYALTVIIEQLTNKKTRDKALMDYRDYVFGRAKESVDLTTKGESIKLSLDEQLAEISDLKERLEGTKKERNERT